MTVFYSDMEPLSRYSPVKLHLSLATRTFSENAVEPKINVVLLMGWLYYCVGIKEVFFLFFFLYFWFVTWMFFSISKCSFVWEATSVLRILFIMKYFTVLNSRKNNDLCIPPPQWRGFFFLWNPPLWRFHLSSIFFIFYMQVFEIPCVPPPRNFQSFM